MGLAQSQPDVVVRPWAVSDSVALEPLILAFLRESTTDIAPTLQSAHALLRMGFAGARQGDPCLVTVARGEVVGFCLWTGVQGPFDWKRNVCHGLGTYVVPAWRRRRVATEMRETGITMARARGYDVLVVSAFDAAARRSLAQVGAVVRGVYMEVTWPSQH